MNHYLFEQLKFARNSTTEYTKKVHENRLEVVPEGLNNNIKWNLGHIYMVMEKFAFQLTDEKTKIPINFPELFNPGTSPEIWFVERPTLEELLVLISEQTKRMEETLSERLEEPLKEIYYSSTGLQINSVQECLSFCLYHEGMHFAAIKSINQQLQNRE